MNIVTVYLYGDVNHVDYQKILLPPDAPANPASEGNVIAPVKKGETQSQCGGWMTTMMTTTMTTTKTTSLQHPRNAKTMLANGSTKGK